jgi:DNA-directed RNA polymerase sigma subunit (sigma70/sigma32)
MNNLKGKEFKKMLVKYRARNKRILEMIEKGMTYEKIGLKYGITKQRVKQILTRFQKQSK